MDPFRYEGWAEAEYWYNHYNKASLLARSRLAELSQAKWQADKALETIASLQAGIEDLQQQLESNRPEVFINYPVKKLGKRDTIKPGDRIWYISDDGEVKKFGPYRAAEVDSRKG